MKSMTKSTTTETIKLLAHPSPFEITSTIIIILVVLAIFIGGLLWIHDGDFLVGVLSLSVSVVLLGITTMFIMSWFIPLNVTKTTQVQKEKFQIVQVEGKLLSSDGLTIFTKDSNGHYGKQTITVDSDTKIKEEGTSDHFTKVKTKITYHTNQKIRKIFQSLPKHQTKTETILTLPKGELK